MLFGFLAEDKECFYVNKLVCDRLRVECCWFWEYLSSEVKLNCGFLADAGGQQRKAVQAVANISFQG